MRFHLVITELEVGGAEKCLTEIACHLKQRGHDVTVISLSPVPVPERSGLVDRLLLLGIRVDFLNATRTIDWFSLKKQLLRIASADRPDAVLSFLFHGNLASASVYPKLGIPWIAGVRVADRSHVRALVSRWIYRKAARVVCVSQTVADHVKNYEGCPVGKLNVITNGIAGGQTSAMYECSSLSTQLAKFGVMSPYLLFVGRYATQKQIPWLIELVRQPYFDQSDLRLVTIGSGPMLPMITAATKQYPSKIVDLGWQANINLFMSGCEMLLLPSAYEGMPNVVLEAMASGKAVAATDVEGVIELLGSNGAAQTSAAGNMSAWIDRVRLLCDDVDLRKRLGAENRVRCQSEFDLAPKMEAYERLLMSVVH